jgi:hypothetical protein
MYDSNFPEKRYRHTLSFLRKHISTRESILDLGVENPFTQVMQNEGYTVSNTSGEDLDLDTSAVAKASADVVTAFEIFEHMVAPFNVLRAIKAGKLVASIPLRLWFAPAYRSKTDPWDRHFHEFEAWQFDWLLNKAGWEIKDRDTWTNPVKKIGVRPLLRSFTPRYYIIFAEKLPEPQKNIDG